MNDRIYEVIFICPHANYYWKVEKYLTLEEASDIAELKNKYNQIHENNGCCRYYVQLMNEEEL